MVRRQSKAKRIGRTIRSLALGLALMLTMTVGMPAGVVPETSMKAYAFNADNFKPNIVKISIGKPVTGSDGRKYLPVTVYFNGKENLGNTELVQFLEGYVRGRLKDGRTFEGVNGLGMTLMGPLKPDAFDQAGSNAYKWEWNEGEGSGEGALKYNIPLLEDGDAQTVENSLATGQNEVNGLKVGDQATLQIESVLDGVPTEMMNVKGNEATFTIEDESNYPKEITVGGGDESPAAEIAQVPQANTGLMYNGNEQNGVNDGTGFSLSGHRATNAGNYTATAGLNDGYTWSDGTIDNKQISWKIDKAELSGNATVTTDVANKTITVKMFGQTLAQGTDYTVTYFDSYEKSVGNTFPVYPGTYHAVVSAKSDSTNYSGSVSGDTFDVPYGILNGADQSYELKSGKSVSIQANGDASDLVSMKMDGVNLDSKDYTVTTDGTTATLDPGYLDTLSLGKHTVTFAYGDGEVSTTLMVKEEDDDDDGDDDEPVQSLVQSVPTTETDTELKAPKTGGTDFYSLQLGIFFLGMAGVTAIVTRRREQD